MRQLLEYQQDLRDPQEFIQSLKIELYPEEVYTFTPKGLVKALPRGATAVDFAYAIHTDVGHQCIGARVNGKMVPLRTRLKNGDIVEIVTQAGHKPSRDWLTFVGTSRARNKIKHLIHSEEKTRAVELGRKLFEKEARRYALNPKTIVDGELFAKALNDFAVGKADDLFAAIGYGKIQPKQVFTKLVRRTRCARSRPKGRWRRSSAGCSGRAKRRSRSAASTTSWCSARAAAARSAARRSSATSRAGRACRFIPRRARTS
jgi:GTP pyrophosphokinase